MFALLPLHPSIHPRDQPAKKKTSDPCACVILTLRPPLLHIIICLTFPSLLSLTYLLTLSTACCTTSTLQSTLQHLNHRTCIVPAQPASHLPNSLCTFTCSHLLLKSLQYHSIATPLSRTHTTSPPPTWLTPLLLRTHPTRCLRGPKVCRTVQTASLLDNTCPHSHLRSTGILKNSNSFQQTSPDARISPTSERPPHGAMSDLPGPAVTDGSRPSAPTRGMSEKEIVQHNTELNAGDAAHRRNSSNARSSMTRRRSSNSNSHDETNPRLKWDEANLYVNESQMGGRMKIDEPKTPYAKHYDPSEDEAEISAINAQDLNVDELDMKPKSSGGKRESDIPGLDLGEPEVKPAARRDSESGRKVELDQDSMDVDGGNHGEGEDGMSTEELEKHKHFEEMRKKHYEMKNIKDLLG